MTLPAAASPHGASLFGIEIDKKLSVPACPHYEDGTMDMGAYDEADKMCVSPDIDSSGDWNLDDGNLVVHFPTGGTPSFSRNSVFQIVMDRGKVRAITIDTKGLADQSDAFDALKKHFGAPEFSQYEARQNLIGARINVLLAGWKFSNGSHIYLQGMTDSIDEGQIAAWNKDVADEIARFTAAKSRKTPNL